MNPSVSFIITARNEDPSIVDATVGGIVATIGDHRCEILVVDDASDERIDCRASALTIIRNPEPVGVTRARQLGTTAATGDVLVWLDAHMTFGAGWLDVMLRQLRPDSLLCAPWHDYHRRRIHAWGSDFRWCEERAYERGLRPGFDFSLRRTRPRVASPRVPMIIGACYMMRRDDYLRLGGFCPLFRTYSGDEWDFSARVWLSGGEVLCVRDARVGHLDRRTFPYPVSFTDVEFNQLVLIRTLFEERTVAVLEEFFQPVPEPIATCLAQADTVGWRAEVQARRTMCDADFFRHIAPRVPISFVAGRVHVRSGHVPFSRVRAALAREEQTLRYVHADHSENAQGLSPTIAAHHRVLDAVVVTWHGRAIVLPGTGSGQRAVGLEMVRAGATLYSDRFAVLDQDGCIHPYLAARSDEQRPARICIVATVQFSPGRRWQLQQASTADAVLALIAHAVSASDEGLFKAVNRAVDGSVALRGRRGPARPLAQALLAYATTACPEN